MVFFQAALLAGYAYAHLLVRRLPPWAGALVHLGVLALAALTLPIGIAPVVRRAAGVVRRALADGAARGVGRAAVRGACRPARRCCRAGSPPAATPRPAIPMSSMPRPISDRSRPYRLSDRDRADAAAQRPVAAVVGRVCRLRRADRRRQPVRRQPAGHRRDGDIRRRPVAMRDRLSGPRWRPSRPGSSSR